MKQFTICWLSDVQKPSPLLSCTGWATRYSQEPQPALPCLASLPFQLSCERPGTQLGLAKRPSAGVWAGQRQKACGGLQPALTWASVALVHTGQPATQGWAPLAPAPGGERTSLGGLLCILLPRMPFGLPGLGSGEDRQGLCIARACRELLCREKSLPLC